MEAEKRMNSREMPRARERPLFVTWRDSHHAPESMLLRIIRKTKDRHS